MPWKFSNQSRRRFTYFCFKVVCRNGTISCEYCKSRIFRVHSIFVSWALRPRVGITFSYSRWPLRILWLALYLSHAFYFHTEAAAYEIYESNMHIKYSGFTVYCSWWDLLGCGGGLLLIVLWRIRNNLCLHDVCFFTQQILEIQTDRQTDRPKKVCEKLSDFRKSLHVQRRVVVIGRAPASPTVRRWTSNLSLASLPARRAPRWSLSLRSSGSAQLSRLPITQPKDEHTSSWRKFALLWICKIAATLGFGNKTDSG